MTFNLRQFDLTDELKDEAVVRKKEKYFTQK